MSDTPAEDPLQRAYRISGLCADRSPKGYNFCDRRAGHRERTHVAHAAHYPYNVDEEWAA